MTRKNDAVSSWSGYNYQGKMMLLCSLLRLQKILDSGKDYHDYWAELETKEDFVIGCGSEGYEKEQELFQVKAKLYSKYVSSYASSTKGESVLSKLLDARNSVDDTKTSQCWLVSAIDITDWDNRSTFSPSFVDVNLYRYPETNRPVGIDEVANFIIAQINKLLSGKYAHLFPNQTQEQSDMVYGSLCLMIDKKVANIHFYHASIATTKYPRKDYRISFSDIVNEIHNTGKDLHKQNEHYHNEKCYEGIAKVWRDGLTECCDVCGSNRSGESECEGSCAALEAIELYFSHNDQLSFWRLLYPDENDCTNWRGVLSLIDKSNISAKLLEPISLLQNSNQISIINNHFELDVDMALHRAMNYDNIPIDESVTTIVIPTLLDLSSKNDSIARRLDNLFKNIEARNAFSGHVITAKEENGNRYASKWSHQQIDEAWQNVRPSSSSGDFIYQEYKTIRILSIETLKHCLEEEEKSNGADKHRCMA